MALAESPTSRPGFDGSMAATAENVQKLRPQQNEDVFLLEQTPLPTFPNVGVEDVKTRRRPDLDNPFAQYYERRLLYSDGTKVPSLVGVALHPTSDSVIGEVPAWWTSIYKGFNKKTADKLNAGGNHTFIQGIPLNHPLSLYQNAWNFNLAADSLEEEFGDEFSTRVMRLVGDSNGAMTGTGVMAYSETFDRVIEDAFLVDPCMVQTIGRAEIVKLLRHPEYLAKELVSLGRQAVRLVMEEEEDALEYLGTIDLSTEFLIGNILLMRGLFWGELGHLAAHLPEDQKAHYYLFDHSIFNQKRALLEIVHGAMGNARPGITNENHTGTHLSIANIRTINAKLAHFSAPPAA